jgi:dTDP-4-amino-4,6-dideoxygalactose transaminase
MKKRIFLSPPHMGELEQQFVRDAFDSNFIAPVGPQVDAFEKAFSEYTGIRHCVALSSGTAAMHLALKELGAGRRGGRVHPDLCGQHQPGDLFRGGCGAGGL